MPKEEDKNTKDKIRIGILRGGDGEHYHASLRRGGDFITHFLEKLSHTYKPVDILVDKEGVWHIKGVPVEPSQLLYKVDAVWNLSHPRFSSILQSFAIKNIGAPSFSPLWSSSREMLRENMKKVGVEMPRHIVLPVYQEEFDGEREEYAVKKARMVFEKFGGPWIVNSFAPQDSKTNMGIHLAKTFPELARAIEDGVRHDKSILVEEFIPGKVAPVHSVSDFRGQEIYVFPPGNFTDAEKEKLVSIAKDLHRHTGANDYLKLDFIMTRRGKLYLLGMDSIPNLKEGSHFHLACESIGAQTHHVMEHIIERALR